MKTLLLTLLIIFVFIASSCKKSKNLPSYSLTSIQHKWMLVSHNGEALRYVGTPEDYYNFSTNDFLYVYVDKIYDTMAYVLLPDKKTLTFYPITNGVRSILGTNYEIKLLDNSQFILGTDFTNFNILDSLKR